MLFILFCDLSLNDADRGLLERVFKSNERPLLVQAKRMGLNEHDAYDCLQQVALYCCRHVDKIADAASRGDESVRHFLLLAAKWQAYAIIERNKKDRERTVSFGLIEDLSDDAVDPIDEFESSADSFESDRVRNALDAMRDKDRSLLMLRFFEDMSAAEIASLSGENENTVVQRLRRATGRFLKAYNGEAADDE